MIKLESNTTFLYVAEKPLTELQIRSLNRAFRGLSSQKGEGHGPPRRCERNSNSFAKVVGSKCDLGTEKPSAGRCRLASLARNHSRGIGSTVDTRVVSLSPAQVSFFFPHLAACPLVGEKGQQLRVKMVKVKKHL